MLRRPVESAQYTSIAYTERLAQAGIDPSVGSVGDAYDNALAETVIGLFKTELIKPRGPGGPSSRSRSPPWSTSTGSTTAASSKPAATSHPPNSRQPTTVNKPPSPRPATQPQVSGHAGGFRAPGQHAVQPHHDDDLSIAAKGRRFIDDVAGYLAWVKQNPHGSVLNTYRMPTAGYLKLHRATCRTINDRPARRYR